MGPRSVPEGTRKGRKAGSCQIGSHNPHAKPVPWKQRGDTKNKEEHMAKRSSIRKTVARRINGISSSAACN